MGKSTLFNPYTTGVVIVAIIVAAWISTRPGDHTTIYTIIGGFVGLYLKNAYDAGQAAEGREETQKKTAEAADSAKEAATVASIAATKAEETAKQLAVVDGKIVEVGRQIDGRLSQLLESREEAAQLRGHEAGRREGGLTEAARQATSPKEVLEVTPDADPIPVVIMGTPLPVTVHPASAALETGEEPNP